MSTTFVPPKPDQWEGPAQAGGFTPPPVDSWQGPSKTPAKLEKPKIEPIEFVNDTLKNIPGSAANLVGNMYQAVRHPVDTAGNLTKVAAGTLQNMTPGYVTPDRPGYSKEANAAGGALKERYGSLDAIKNTIRTDPVGAAADASVVAGGVSGLARGAGMAAKVANLPRVASAANTVADAARVASDVANPLTLPLKAAGSVAKGIARPLVNSALDLRGKTARYGATPAKAILEETSGIRPTTIKLSAGKKLDELNQQLEALAAASGNSADLTAARRVIADEITKVKKANGLADDLTPMQTQLTEAREGFGGAVTPTGEVAAQQHPLDFLGMKRQFGEDFTKFDAAVPLKDSVRQTGNKAYHELSTEFNRAVPEGKDINQRVQSLIPGKQGAQRAEERAGVVERAVDRGTRPTGALALPLMGAHAFGPLGAIGAMTLQEALAEPTIRMALARTLYGTGKAAKTPVARRALTTLGVEGEAGQDQLPKFAKGGIIRRKTILVDAQTRKPSGIMAEAGPEAIVPLGGGKTADIPTVPEKPDAIAEQLGQLSDHKRRVVMIPRGTFPHAAPEGMVTHNDQSGNRFIFNPHLIGIHDIKMAVATNRLPSILGAAHGGMGAPDKSKLRGAAVNVAAKSPKGFTVQSTATDMPHLKTALKQSTKILPKGGRVSVEPPSKEIARRLRA